MVLEKEINNRITSKFKRNGFDTIQTVRINPTEIDIIILDSKSLELAGYEIKRSSWKKALNQAIRNKSYCHFSYVILPENEKKNVKLDVFKKHGIGLIYFKILKRGIKLFTNLEPQLNIEINRIWKKTIYSKFNNVLK